MEPSEAVNVNLISTIGGGHPFGSTPIHRIQSASNRSVIDITKVPDGHTTATDTMAELDKVSPFPDDCGTDSDSCLQVSNLHRSSEDFSPV